MTTEPRKPGIGVLGDTPWGTHGCLFYDTQQDLLDTVIPYLKAGLENHEFCLWVISEPLTREAAAGALRQSVPDFDRYISERSIEVVAASEWYIAGGVLDLRGIIHRFHEKLDEVLDRGYKGLRATGGASWLQRPAREHLCRYETELDKSIAGHCMRVLCTYPLAQSSAAELLDVTRAHQFAAAKRNGDWEVIEAP